MFTVSPTFALMVVTCFSLIFIIEDSSEFMDTSISSCMWGGNWDISDFLSAFKSLANKLQATSNV